MQHWHRDNALLFGADETPAVPPYAINVFVPGAALRAEAGPTEFQLRSHVNASLDGRALAAAGLPGHASTRFEGLPVGSGILADYRTVHRGTPNQLDLRRALGMLIFARRWWSDAENYGRHDIGGFGTRREHDPDSEAGRRETLLEPLRLAEAQRALHSSAPHSGDRAADAPTPTLAQRRTHFFGLVNRWEQGLVSELQEEWWAAQSESRQHAPSQT